jgi:hypothetical protein
MKDSFFAYLRVLALLVWVGASPALLAQQLPLPPSKPIVVAPTLAASAAGSIVVSKDDLALAQTVIQTAGGLFAVLALVFGTIVGINVFNGTSILKDARAELNAAKEEMLSLRKAKQDYEGGVSTLKIELEKIAQDAIGKIRDEAQASYELANRKLYRKSTLTEYIREILLELESATPNEDVLYPKVTALVGYLDEDIVAVYLACFRKLSPNSDVVQTILKNGFRGMQSCIPKS